MAIARLIAVLAICALPATAAAQPWRDAYDARQYEKAADLLHELLTDPEFAIGARDPEPFRHLALLYANGLGVPRDPIAACSLAEDAQLAAQMAPPKKPLRTMEDFAAHQAAEKDAERFTAAHCDPLSAADRLTAGRTRGGCYRFGMPDEEVTFDGQAVRVNRDGIFIADTADDTPAAFGCPAFVARVRTRTIDPPAGAARSATGRHFVELFMWRRTNDTRDPSRKYALTWHVYEVFRSRVAVHVIDEIVHSVAQWPRGSFPDDLDRRLTIAMTPAGQVWWRLDEATPRGGWFELPAQAAAR